MADCTVSVEPGVCKMPAKITAKMNDEMKVVVTIESPCKFVKAYANALQPIEPYMDFMLPIIQNPIYTPTEGTIQHTACPIPCAVAKAVEVAADLGLKKDVSIKIE